MKRSAFFILSLILFLNIFAPIAQAATDTYQPTLDESGQCVHGSLAGEYDDYGWAIFIGNDQFDTAGGIRFPNITIDQAEIINDANLTVYYPGGFDWNTGTLYLMIYGYDADDAPRDLTWSDIVNGPRTDSLTVFNMSLMNTAGSYVIDVTDQIQEIVNRYGWENGNAIAFTTLHILEDDAGEYWYEWASNTGAYKNKRPSLTVKYGESPDEAPPGEWEYVDQYQGYTIYRGASGVRVVIFEDASGQDWILASTNQTDTGTWITYNNSLPFNVDIDPDIQDTAIVIGNDIWLLGDTGTNLTLRRSQDFGATFKTMHSFTLANSAEAYTMDYNPDLSSINILAYDDTNDIIFFMSYNASTDSTIQAPLTLFDGANVGPNDMDLAVDENDDIWVGATMAGAWGNQVRLWTAQRIGGAWSGTKIFNPGDAFMWNYVDVHVARDKPNNEKPVVFVVTTATGIYVERKEKTTALGTMDLDEGEWLTGTDSIGRDLSVGTHFNSVLSERSEYNDPYGAYFDLMAVYMDSIAAKQRVVATWTHYPYPNVVHYDEANYSSSMNYQAIYEDWTGGSRIYTQDINDKDHLWEISPNWMEYHAHKVPDWNARRKINHHEDIEFYTVATRPFSDPYWIIYLNGTIIDTLPYDEFNQTDIEDLIDDLTGGDPEDPGSGSEWTGSEPWYIDRQRTQLYFTILGLGLIIPPWILAVQKRRIDIVITAIFLNLIGVALLYGVSYI